MVGKAARRVLITRPVAQGEQTANRVAGLGFEPVVLPLRVVDVLPVEVPNDRFDAVAATSANAFAGLSSDRLGGLAATPVFCVGDRTAAAARAAGFKRIETGAGTAGLLADMLIAQGVARLLYLCGTPRRPDLEDRLAAFGCKVTVLETYGSSDRPLAATDRETLSKGQFDVALLYSAESAATLARHLSDWPVEQLATKRFLCLSQAVADRFPPNAVCLVAAKPTENHLLRLLESIG